MKKRWSVINKEKYIAELTKLLGFMSPWDRRAELRRYERMFDQAENVEELLERIGTPTKVAVELARDYVATPPPDMSRWENLPPPLPDEPEETPGQDQAEPEPEPETAPPVLEKTRIRGGGVAGFTLFLLLIGIPVTLLLLAVGLPFLTTGAGVIAGVIEFTFRSFGSFRLFSDLLLTLGADCVLAAAGLVLGWLGLWVSLSLCRAWITRVLVPLARKLCMRKETVSYG